MNKKVLLLLVAALLLTSAVACNKDKGNDQETGATTTPTESGDFIVVPGTDADGNPVTYLEPAETQAPEDDPSEANPTFTDVTKQVVVVARAATIRTSTVVADNNGYAWPSENRVLDVTGESENWYRINYDGKPCYITKGVVGDYDVIQAFTNLSEHEEVEISEASVNVRSYPSTATSYSIRGQLTKGTKVTRVAVSDKWSRILFEVKSETETDESGNAKVEIMQYYVSNDCIKSLTDDTATDTVADTEAATDAVTDAAN